MKLSDKQLAILRLFRSRNVGPVTFQKLIARYGDAQKAMDDFATLNKTYKKKFEAPPVADIQKEASALHALGGQFIFMDDAAYPPLLKHITDAPPVLSVLGNPNALTANFVAVVGNRNASGASMKFTQTLSADLTAKGIGVISGLARGIDTAAHKGALAGTTVAVLAGGVDHIYPPENKQLYEDILSHGGAVISEMPLGMHPSQNHFPRRNRIVSGMARATAVVEAAKRSGSLITARLALEHNRDVYAVPNTPMDPRSEGPNHLLAESLAYVLRNVDDILQHTNFDTPENLFMTGRDAKKTSTINTEDAPLLHLSEAQEPATTSKHTPQTPQEAILSLLSTTPMDADALLQASTLDETTLTITLTELELLGAAKRQGAGFVRA